MEYTDGNDLPAEIVSAADDIRPTEISVPDNVSDLVAIDTESQRAIAETQAQFIMARRFPRDVNRAWAAVLPVLRRPDFASACIYAYNRGGTTVTGPTIRMIEELARAWGNLSWGIVEVGQDDEGTIVQSFCTDYESNIRIVRTFKVPRYRFTRKRGRVRLEDPRDIYEVTANYATRRLRACIQQVMPKWYVDDAITEVHKTLSGGGGVPLTDRVRRMVAKFQDIGVTQEMLEDKLGHGLSAVNEDELVEFIAIYNSIKDKQEKRSSFFNLGAKDAPEASEASKRIKGGT